MNSPNFWDNKEQAELTLKSISELKSLTQDIKRIKENNENNLEMIELLLVEKDDELIQNIEEDVYKESQELEKLSVLLLLNVSIILCAVSYAILYSSSLISSNCNASFNSSSSIIYGISLFGIHTSNFMSIK